MDGFQKTLEHAATLERLADWELARSMYERAFSEASIARDVRCLANASRGSARVLRSIGRLDEAEELAELSIEIAARGNLALEEARASNVLGLILYSRGAIHAAAERYQAALETAREVRDDELVGLACTNLGVLAEISDDFEGAFQFYLESIAAAVRTGNMRSYMYGYNNLGLLAAYAHEWMHADLLLHRALELVEQVGDTAMTAKFLLNRAEPLVQVGELETAQEVLDRADSIAESVHDVQNLAEAARLRALLAIRLGEKERATMYIARSLLLSTRAGLRLERAQALEQFAVMQHDAGQLDDALTHLAQASFDYFTAGDTRDGNRCRDLLSVWSHERVGTSEP